ncbi:MAG: GntR family transcriptional regulator [Dorea sp.]|nr:GntR family transcriptional regulator [Dorea sp.]
MLQNTSHTQIYRETIKSQAAAYIREAILTGQILPEERIVPSVIADALKTGRGVIREALMVLETEGLVENIPYKGSFVSKLNRDDIGEVCSLRLMIETYSVKEAANAITEEDYHSLAGICRQMQESASQNRLYDIVKCDSAFHGYLVKKVSQSILYDAWDITSGKMSTLFFSMFTRGYPIPRVAKEHFELLEELKKSPEAYLDALHCHYERTKRCQCEFHEPGRHIYKET